MRLLRALPALLLVGAAPPGGGRDPAPTTHTIEIRNFAFSLASLEVAPGDTVVWINRDAAPHTATDSLGRWDSGELRAAGRWSWTATEAGRFGYLCAYHPSMRGTIHVRPAGAARGLDGGPEDTWTTP